MNTIQMMIDEREYEREVRRRVWRRRLNALGEILGGIAVLAFVAFGMLLGCFAFD